MNITTLINAVRDSIKNTAGIATWCTTNYGKVHTVYKGVDARKPPPDTHYPIVHIFPVMKTAGYGLEQEDHVLAVTCGVNDSAQTIDTSGSVDVYEYTGIDKLEAFRKLVESAVAAVIPAGTRVEMVTIEYETIEFFPFLLASMEMKIVQDYAQGDDVLK